MIRWVVAGLVAGAVLLAGLPVLLLASLSGMDAAQAMSACLAGLPATSTAVNRPGLTVEQAQNASTIVGVGQSLVGERGETIAVAVALVESGLVNVDHGTGSSLGLFQQDLVVGFDPAADGPGVVVDAVLSASAGRARLGIDAARGGRPGCAAVGVPRPVRR